MGFTISSLTNYVDQTSLELLTALQFKGETADMANIHAGIKSAEALQLLSTTPFPQDGTACGFNASGDASFTQRNLTTYPIKYQDSFCPRALEAKWTQQLLKKGQDYNEGDVPKAIFDDIVKQIIRINETMDWQGNLLTLANGLINKYDGLKTIIAAATGTVTAAASTWNAANARAIMKTIIAGIPAAQKGDPNTKVFVGYDVAETYRQVLMDANLFHVPTGTGTQQGMVVEGSVHPLIPVHGLDGLAATTGVANPFIFAIDPSRNFHLGVDMAGEEEKFTLWLDGSDNETVKYSVRFRRGWQIAYPSEIVEYANT